MARHFTKESLTKLKSNGNDQTDKILQDIIMAIHNCDFELERLEDYIREDEYGIESDTKEYYGEYKVGETTLGVTIRYGKKMSGLAGRYKIEVETDFNMIEGNAEYSAAAWRRVEYQMAHKSEKIDEGSLNNLINLMGI
jgi:hypothetical protein